MATTLFAKIEFYQNQQLLEAFEGTDREVHKVYEHAHQWFFSLEEWSYKTGHVVITCNDEDVKRALVEFFRHEYPNLKIEGEEPVGYVPVSIAQTIQDQVGHRAFVMLGAKKENMVHGECFFEFKIGSNAKKVTHIRITLAPNDTYTVRFFSVGHYPNHAITERGEFEGIYADMLHSVIETHTGMYTSL